MGKNNLRFGLVAAFCCVGATSAIADDTCDSSVLSGSGESYYDARCEDVNGDGEAELVALKDTRGGATKQYVFAGKALRSVSRQGRQSPAKVAPKALSSFCKSVRSLTPGEIWKSIASRHISDARKNSTSFITVAGTRAPSNSCIRAYDNKGNLVHSLGRYFPTGGAYSSRFYGGAGCGDNKSANSVSAIARSKTGSTEIYLNTAGSQCIRIPNPSLCYNSSGC